MHQIRSFHVWAGGTRPYRWAYQDQKSIDMDAVDAAGGVAGRAEIFRRSQFRAAEKSGRGTVSGQIAVSIVCGGELRLPADGTVEPRKDGFHCFGLELCTLLGETLFRMNSKLVWACNNGIHSR